MWEIILLLSCDRKGNMKCNDKKSLKAEDFINDGEILDTLKYADENKE